MMYMTVVLKLAISPTQNLDPKPMRKPISIMKTYIEKMTMSSQKRLKVDDGEM